MKAKLFLALLFTTLFLRAQNMVLNNERKSRWVREVIEQSSIEKTTKKGVA